MNIRKLATSAALAGALLFAGAANAAVLTLDFVGFQNDSRSGSVTVNSNTINNASVGMFKFNVTNVDGEPPIDVFSQILAFCIEADILLADPTNYELLSAGDYFNDATKLARVEQLFSQFFASTGSADTDAAFQLALWEVIYDSGPFDLASGNFIATGFDAALGIAAGWLATLSSGDGFSLWALQAPGSEGSGVTNESQDLITWEVPEPASLALLGLGLIGFGALRRRKLA